MAATSSTTESSPSIRSLIPARIDRLPWSRFHTRLVIALGVAWILDGLEITIAANVGPDLTLHNTLNMSAGAVSDIAWWYLIGEVIGALFFGRLSDKLGRRNLFMITLGVYLVGSGLTALTPAGGYWFIFLYATRVIAGMGIGGEYAAINSAIDEMIPAKYRGRVDLAVNGTYWAGAILGTIVTLFLLNHVVAAWGWRIAYLVGPVLALVIIFVRRHLPESPRWQIMHGRQEAAEASIAEIEHDVSETKGELPPVDESKELEIRPVERFGYLKLLELLFRHYPKRAVLVSALMITQSFLYNAIFFTSGLVLEFYFHVNPTDTGYYFFAFAAGNLAGPLLLGRLFDTVGRKKMISGTYILAGAAPDHYRVPVQERVAERDDPDDLLGGRVLLRVRGRQRRLPDRERGLPARGPGAGHRRVLRDRAALRRVRLALVRPPDRRRIEPQHAVRRLHRRCGCHDPGWRRRDLLRGRRGRQVAGGRRDAALGRLETAADHLPLWRRPRGHRPSRAVTRDVRAGPIISSGQRIGGFRGDHAPGLELHPVVERLVGRVLLSEVRGLRALHRQVGRRAQRAER